jgi:AcrR family transcriptional regulator
MSDIAAAAGVSRQAVYLHFRSRADLLVATTRYMDEVSGVEERLADFREAATGEARLAALVRFWGEHVPSIYGVARALLATYDTDEAAAAAWRDRMAAVRDGCQAVVMDLQRDGTLAEVWTPQRATDLLWSMLSVRMWEHLTIECGWSPDEYAKYIHSAARRALVAGA